MFSDEIIERTGWTKYYEEKGTGFHLLHSDIHCRRYWRQLMNMYILNLIFEYVSWEEVIVVLLQRFVRRNRYKPMTS